MSTSVNVQTWKMYVYDLQERPMAMNTVVLHIEDTDSAKIRYKTLFHQLLLKRGRYRAIT